jgi:hypothetical protein
MVKKINPSFVAYFAAYLKGLLGIKKNGGAITAEMFQEQVTAAANDYLKENYGIDAGAVRTAITQSTPEAECANAIKARSHHNIGSNDRISYYKTQAEIGNIDPEVGEATLAKAKEKYNGRITNWTTKTNMLLYDASAGKMRQLPVLLTPNSAVYCGECWICKTDVMSYTGRSIEPHIKAPNTPAVHESGTTPCGDCEHVSAIMASYIAGMLKSGGFAKFYWASYYVACVECNRKKSNYIGVKLHPINGWEVDEDGVNAIVDAIFPNPLPYTLMQPHASEYNPIRNALTNRYNNMNNETERKPFRLVVYNNIVAGTQTWCEAANEQMAKSKASSKMAFNVSRIIVAITGHLDVITNKLQQKAKSGKAASVTAVNAAPVTAVKAARRSAKLKRKKGGMPTGDDMTDDDDDNAYILRSYNLDDAEAKVEDEEEEEEEDAKIKYRHDMIEETVIAEFFTTTFGALLIEQYNIDNDIFEMLITRLSHSMEEILISLHDIQLARVAQPNVFTFSQGAKTELQQATEAKAAVANKIGENSQSSQTDESPSGATSGSPPRGASSSRTAPAFVNETDTQSSQSDEFTSDATSGSQPRGTPSSAFVNKTDTPATGTNNTQALAFVTPADEKATSSGSDAVGDTDIQDRKRQAISHILDQDLVTDSDTENGGSRLNKRHSKNRTKRISYIKHKQTRKNQHSRKTNKK